MRAKLAEERDIVLVGRGLVLRKRPAGSMDTKTPGNTFILSSCSLGSILSVIKE